MPGSTPPPRRWQSPRVLAGAAGALVIVAVVVVLVATLGSGSGSQHHGLPSVSQRQDLTTIFSEGSGIFNDPTTEIAHLHALGVSVVRVSFTWAQIAPSGTSRRLPAHFDASNPNAYPAKNWIAYDQVVRLLAAHHMKLDAVLAPPAPRWANGPGTPKEKTPPPTVWNPNPRMFEQFVRAVGTRYSGHFRPRGQKTALPRVAFWSLWNEPNAGVTLAPQTIDRNTVENSPYRYRMLADAAWTGLHATGHGSDTTLLGELAPIGSTIPGAPGDYAVMTPLRFLRALYCVGSDLRPLQGSAATARHCPATAAASKQFAAANPVLFHATDFSMHPYPFALPPTTPVPNGPDDLVLVQLPHLFSALDAVQRAYGSTRRFDVYDTEFGYITNPPAVTVPTSPKLAARYLNESEYLSWRMPRLLSYDQFTLTDPFPVPGEKRYGGFASGLETDVGTPKPGYYAFRMPVWLPQTHAAAGHKLEVWGCVRPAKLYAMARRAPAQIQYRAGHHGPWRTLETVSTRTTNGYFDELVRFPASGQTRIRWTPPQGAPMTSRVTAVSVG